MFANYGMYNVEGGHRAIVYSRLTGISNIVQGEGTHFIIPWLQRPYVFNVRSTPRIIKSLTGSRGSNSFLQHVILDVRLVLAIFFCASVSEK